MKRALSQYKGQRITVYARVDRFGKRLNPKDKCFVPTVCLQSVTNTNSEFIASHVWIDYNCELQALNLQQGDIVRFSGLVKPYVRSPKSFTRPEDLLNPMKRIDYNLFHIQDMKIVQEARAVSSVG